MLEVKFGKNRKVYTNIFEVKFWLLGQEIHRENGPAVERSNGTKYWYLDGTKYTESEYYAELSRRGIKKC